MDDYFYPLWFSQIKSSLLSVQAIIPVFCLSEYVGCIFSSIPIYAFATTKELYLYVLWSFIFLVGKLFFHPNSILIQEKNSVHKTRGRTFSFKKITLIITAVFAPVVGGYIATLYGLKGLVIFASFIYLLAMLRTNGIQNITFQLDLKKLVQDRLRRPAA